MTPEERVNQARAEYTAAMSRQEANEARHAEAKQAIVEAETAIADCELIETSLAEAVATTSQEYLQATRDANNVAVKAIEKAPERSFGEGWAGEPLGTLTAGGSVTSADTFQKNDNSANDALRAVERVIPADSIK